jgi:hypothetical protein
MFIRDPSSSLPHPVYDDPEPAEADAQFGRITRAIADIGRRNDEMRRRIAENLDLVERLIAEGDRDT